MAITRKDIKGYEKLYAITRDGRVYSYPKKYGRRGRYLKFGMNHQGYLQVNLSKNSKAKTFRVNRLVAETYIPNEDITLQVNHINCDKTDNRVENLEWCTPKTNINHAWKNKLCEGTRQASYKRRIISFEDAEDIRYKYENGVSSQRALGREYGMTHTAIQQIINNKSYKEKGANNGYY